MGDAILEVLALYCRAIDRCDAELLRRLYWPEAIEDRGYFSGDRDAFVAWDAFAFGALHIGKRGAEDRVYRFRSAPPPTG
jgi:hypothetical protein